MPQPSQNAVHIDALLTDISVAYIQDSTNFIASRVFPIVPVDKQSDLYFTYTKNDWFRDEAQRRGDSEESVGSGYGLSTSSYRCQVWAIHKDIGDQVRANSDSPLDPDRDATEWVTQRLMLRQEVQWAADYFTSGVWGTDVTGTNSGTTPDSTHAVQWDDQVSSDPINDIEAGKTTILTNTGMLPNKLVLGYQVYAKLKTHPDLIDRYKYTQTDVLTPQMLARLFDLEEVIVGKSIQATNKEGETAAYSLVQGKNAMLCYSAPAPSLLKPSAGYIFAWRGVSGGLGENIGVSRFRMQERKADRVEGEIAFADQVVATDLGYMFNSIVS